MPQDTLAKVRRDLGAAISDLTTRLDATGADIDEMKRNITSIVARQDLGVEPEPEPTPDPAPTNTVPPTISAATEGVACTITSTGTWTESPTFAYQWLLDGTAISGATAATYTPTHSDAGHQLSLAIAGTANSQTATATSAAVTIAAAGGGGGPVYTQDFSGGIGDWEQAALPAPGYAYTTTTVVTGVVGGRVRMAVSSGKEYATISDDIPGLTAGQQYEATITFANRTGLVWASVVTDRTNSRTTLNRTEEASASSGTITIRFWASTANYLRIRLQTETDGAHIDIASVSVSATSAADPNFAGAFWRTDRRKILREFLAEHTQATYPGNPRGWLADRVGNAFNATTFGAIMLERADQVGAACVAANAQGLILWDFPNGQEFGHVTTYVGAPDEIAAWAPEMDVVADAYIARLQTYGLRLGVCLRPQHIRYGATLPTLPDAAYPVGSLFLLTSATPPHRAWTVYEDADFPLAWYDYSQGAGYGNTSGPGQESIRTSSDVTAARDRLISRITYCKTRWGMTLFYVDSTTWEYGEPLPASIWQEIQAAHPDCLIMPENEDGYTYHPYSVPYGELDGGSVGPEYYPTNPDAMMMLALDESVTTEIFDLTKVMLKQQYAAKRLLLLTLWADETRLPMIDEIMAP